MQAIIDALLAMPRAEIAFPQIDPAALTIDLRWAFGDGAMFFLRWYALAYIAGLVLGWRYMVAVARGERFWGPGQARPQPVQIDDFLFWAAIGVIAGGRLGYVLFYKPDMIWKDPAQILQVWNGGMAFHGGLIGVLLAIVFFARRNAIPVLTLGDLTAIATPIGLFFGRIANFINGELYGRPTDAAWAMRFPTWNPQAREWVFLGGEQPRHPSQLYEAALEGVVLFLILRLAITRFGVLRRPGLSAGLFLIGYGAFRSFVELFREPDGHLPEALRGFVTLGMLYSLPMVIAGAALLAFALRSPPKPA